MTLRMYTNKYVQNGGGLFARTPRILFLAAKAFLLALLIPTTLMANVLTVRQDGTGDYTNLLDAVSASSTGDTLLVWPGLYQDPAVLVTHSVTILSTEGPDSTTVDGQGSVQSLEFRSWSTAAIVDGFTFVNGFASGVGGSIRVTDNAQATVRNCRFTAHTNIAMVVGSVGRVTIEDCSFDGNTAPTTAAAIYISGGGARAEIVRCVFTDNSANGHGGAIGVVLGGYIHAVDCEFRDNFVVAQNNSNAGGAISTDQSSDADIEGCLFVGNTAYLASAVRCYDAVITNNTFHANVGVWQNGSEALRAASSEVIANIFSENIGWGLYIYQSGIHSCNVYWNNTKGPLVPDGVLSPEEVQADPQYCDAGAGDFRISTASPAAPASNPCGLHAGAFAIGCTTGVDPVIVLRPDTISAEIAENEQVQKTLLIGNAGGAALSWQVDPTLPTWLTVTPDSGITAPGLADSVTFAIDADTLAAGFYQCWPEITNNTPGNPAPVVPVELTVIRGGDLFVSDSLLVYPDLYLGASSTLGVMISNRGAIPLSGVASVDIPDFFPLTPTFTIQPGDSLFEQITYQPLSEAIHVGTLTFVTSDADGDTLTVTLQGGALDHNSIVVSSDSIVETLAPDDDMRVTMTLSNSGPVDGPVEFDVVIAPGSPRTIFFDDFETGELIGWQDGGGTATKTVTSESAANGTSFSYRETNSVTGHYNGIYWDFGSIQPTDVSFWIRSGSTTAYDTYVALRDNQFREVVFFFTQGTGTFYCNANVGGHNTYPYDADTWYHIELRDIDFGAKTFDYVVDDSLVQPDISFRNASDVTNIGRLDLYNYGEGAEGWWDEIRVFPASPNQWLAIDPWSGSVPGAQSAGFDVVLNSNDLLYGVYTASIIVTADDPVQTLIIDMVSLQLTIDSTATAVVTPVAPMVSRLEQNFPNPFNPTTSICYSIREREHVSLRIYNVAGQLVRTLVNEVQTPRSHGFTVEWNGTFDAGENVSSGVYFYKLVTKDFSQTKKMVLLK